VSANERRQAKKNKEQFKIIGDLSYVTRKKKSRFDALAV
jgi:hypothetical protein